MLVIVSSFHSTAPRSGRMSMQIGKENPISIAFGIERSSAMDRGDLANLSAFVTVADQRSFRAAASRLDVTPSALSHSMRQLEARLGGRLLNRTTRSVSVTGAVSVCSNISAGARPDLRRAGGFEPRTKPAFRTSTNLCDQYGWSGGDHTGLATLPMASSRWHVTSASGL